MSGLYPRGNVWWTDVYTRATPDSPLKRRRVSTGCYLGDKTRAELIAAQLKAGVEVHRSELMTLNKPSGSERLSELFNRLHNTRWARAKSAKRAQDSCRFLLAELGDVEIREVTLRMQGELVARMIARGLGDSMINARLSVLSVALHAAHDEGALPTAPKIAWRPKPKGRADGHWLEPAQIRALITNEERPVARALWSLMAATGCRPAEALALTWSDIDLVGRFITLRKTKNGTTRVVPMVASLVTTMQNLRDIHQEPKLFGFRSEAWWRQQFDSALAAARIERIKGVTFYLLRHSAATNLIAAGLDIRYVQVLLGHSDIKQTVTYAKAKPIQLRAMMDVAQVVMDADETVSTSVSTTCVLELLEGLEVLP